MKRPREERFARGESKAWAAVAGTAREGGASPAAPGFLHDLNPKTAVRFLEAGVYVLKTLCAVKRGSASDEGGAICRRLEELLAHGNLRDAAPVFHWSVLRTVREFREARALAEATSSGSTSLEVITRGPLHPRDRAPRALSIKRVADGQP